MLSGFELPMDRLAFSQPTAQGRALAESYTGTTCFLVYAERPADQQQDQPDHGDDRRQNARAIEQGVQVVDRFVQFEHGGDVAVGVSYRDVDFIQVLAVFLDPDQDRRAVEYNGLHRRIGLALGEIGGVGRIQDLPRQVVDLHRLNAQFADFLFDRGAQLFMVGAGIAMGQ